MTENLPEAAEPAAAEVQEQGHAPSGSANIAAVESPEMLGDAMAHAVTKLRTDEESRYADFSTRRDYPQDLIKAQASYAESEEFLPGTLVQWKTFMKNRRYPAYGRPAVVVGRIQAPVSDRDADGDYREPEDIILGFIDGEGNFRTFGFASCRFQVFEV